MNKILIVILLAYAQILAGQINITEQQDAKQDAGLMFEAPDLVYEDAPATNESDETTENEQYDSIRLGFKTFDTNLLKPFLTKGLQSEIDDLEDVFSQYTKLFNEGGETTFEDRIDDGFSIDGTLGLARFRSSNRQIGTLEFMYTYNGKDPIISEILVVNDGVKFEFPLLFGKIEPIIEELKKLNKAKNYPEVVEKYKELVTLTENLEDYYQDPDNGLTKKSNYYGNLAWNCLLAENPKDAIKYAEKGIEIWSYNRWIYTNLALGHAMNDDFDEAAKLYTTLGDEWFKGKKYFKDVFLEDLRHLNSLNIEVPRYDEYILLLEKM